MGIEACFIPLSRTGMDMRRIVSDIQSECGHNLGPEPTQCAQFSYLCEELRTNRDEQVHFSEGCLCGNITGLHVANLLDD